MQASQTITRSAPFLMTVGLENMNADLTIWFTWYFHISSKYYSLFAMQFQLFQLHLTCFLVLWWGEKSWALKWQMMTDHVAIKNLRPTSFCLLTWRKKKKKKFKKSCIGHSLDSRVYGWKHGHFVRLDRTLWPGFVNQCWSYHQAGFLSGVNGSLSSRLHHITICNTKVAVKLCLQFLVKFDRIVSNET